jgi:hypothetical protein
MTLRRCRATGIAVLALTVFRVGSLQSAPTDPVYVGLLATHRHCHGHHGNKRDNWQLRLFESRPVDVGASVGSKVLLLGRIVGYECWRTGRRWGVGARTRTSRLHQSDRKRRPATQ